MRIAVVWFIGFQLLALFMSGARRLQLVAGVTSADGGGPRGFTLLSLPLSHHWRAYDVPCLRPAGR
jgi:hypothetical protein